MSRTGLSLVAAVFGILFFVSSCDYDPLIVTSAEENTETMTLNIRTKSTYGSNFNSQGVQYEDGSLYENYLDLSGGDYRVYFFTNSAAGGGDDTFIAEFNTSSFTENDNGLYRTYYMRGTVPDNLLSFSDFKVVVLANWGTYPDPTYGVTKIADICTPTAATGTFQRTTSQVIGPGNLIPFYGVQDYTGIEFIPDETTTLPTAISMLRAMAKVEVLLTNDDLSFSDVRICRYNDTGCCAPDGVYDGSYVTTGGWSVDGIHLYNANGEAANDEDQSDASESDKVRKVHLYNSLAASDADQANGIYEKWVAYIPEYSNASADDCCYIEVLFNDQMVELGTPEPFVIYFSDYNTSTGKVIDSSDCYDIGRNIIYRFTVTYDDSFRVIPQEWEYTFDNTFEF